MLKSPVSPPATLPDDFKFFDFFYFKISASCTQLEILSTLAIASRGNSKGLGTGRRSAFVFFFLFRRSEAAVGRPFHLFGFGPTAASDPDIRRPPRGSLLRKGDEIETYGFDLVTNKRQWEGGAEGTE